MLAEEANKQDMQTMREQRDLPVGVFDSGVGGISVLREMVRLLPQEDFLFFGDSACHRCIAGDLYGYACYRDRTGAQTGS